MIGAVLLFYDHCSVHLTISTLGLIRLSLMMNDPFSHEDWALRVGALCTSTILDANAMLSSRHREVVTS